MDQWHGSLRASDADREQVIEALKATFVQNRLAKAVGVSHQTVILIENGRYLPSLPLAFTIARFLGLTVDEMFRSPGQPVR